MQKYKPLSKKERQKLAQMKASEMIEKRAILFKLFKKPNGEGIIALAYVGYKKMLKYDNNLMVVTRNGHDFVHIPKIVKKNSREFKETILKLLTEDLLVELANKHAAELNKKSKQTLSSSKPKSSSKSYSKSSTTPVYTPYCSSMNSLLTKSGS